MRDQKIAVMAVCMVVLFSASACGASDSESGSGSSEGIAPSSAVREESFPASSLSESAGSEAPGGNPPASSGQPQNSGPADGSAAQQTVFNQIEKALNTKVPLMLPTSIPVEKNRYLTATTASQTTNYKVDFYEADQAAKIDSQAASKGTLIASLEGIGYKDDGSAKESISDYKQINPAEYDEFADLGHNIRAAEQAGTGHQQLLWNEGRWYIHLDFPIDPAFRNKDYPDSKQLAENIVAYLDKNMLPAPQKIGVIRIANWNMSEGTVIEWQSNQTVYQISSRDPMTALKIAVAMKLK